MTGWVLWSNNDLPWRLMAFGSRPPSNRLRVHSVPRCSIVNSLWFTPGPTCIIKTFGPSFFSPRVAWCWRRIARLCQMRVVHLKTEMGWEEPFPCSTPGHSLPSMPGALLSPLPGAKLQLGSELCFAVLSPSPLSWGGGSLGCASSDTCLAEISFDN